MRKSVLSFLCTSILVTSSAIATNTAKDFVPIEGISYKIRTMPYESITGGSPLSSSFVTYSKEPYKNFSYADTKEGEIGYDMMNWKDDPGAKARWQFKPTEDGSGAVIISIKLCLALLYVEANRVN